MREMLTHHAEVRCQQRGIRPEIVDALLAFGRLARRHGADVCFMDGAARRRARRELGAKGYARISDRLLDTYLVVADDGAVVTAAKRRRRIKLH